MRKSQRRVCKYCLLRVVEFLKVVARTDRRISSQKKLRRDLRLRFEGSAMQLESLVLIFEREAKNRA